MAGGNVPMPSRLYGFVLSFGAWHQMRLLALSILAFAAGTAPLEVQRRLINTAVEGGSYRLVAALAAAYLGMALVEGVCKLGLNLYRNWLGESAILWLRKLIFRTAEGDSSEGERLMAEGVPLSIILAEAEPVGGFIGTSLSEPMLQIGILATVAGYLLYLQPVMAVAVAIVFVPQALFVPSMQSAINRRVEERIKTMRDISETVIEEGMTFGTEKPQDDRMFDVFGDNMSIYKLKFSMNFLMNILVQIGYAGIFALGGYYVVNGSLEIGTVVAFISGLAKINAPWGDLVDWYRDLRVTQVKYQLIRSAAEITLNSHTAPGEQ
ncbi:ABC transporter ATP-binding protein (plasmid) [Rhizobium sp. CB3090]|uniref:ABC transporter ATP-binding protein n=1 Tax=Rhizobium sp. CB3090 TaxID=3039156 RepID=UPI0024B09E0F|nr:ABC transporter ATP-binding protein [Rhizobium sp. CB3090]WFU13420.1 ABC transporter ATP-binding protein [Rhizobium sp. CB3090]